MAASMLDVVAPGARLAAPPEVGSIGEIPAVGSIHEDIVDYRPSSARPARTANEGTNHDA